MRALVCDAFGPVETLRVGDLPDPDVPPGFVAIDVHAAGLNFPDVLCVQGLYQFKPEPPFAPGQEGAGVVSAVGEGVTSPAVGDRVAFVVLSGGVAERVIAPANMVAPVPSGVDLTTAGGVSMVYGTSYYALKDRAALKPGETLLVLGAAGGVGLAAVELGKAMGATVIAAASTPEKLALAKNRGADELINYADEDLRDRIKEITAKQGADVIYDPVGGPLAEPAVRSMGWGGRYLVVGFAAGDIPSIPLNLPLLKSCAIMGVFWGAWAMREPAAAKANFADIFAMVADGRLRPHISQTLPLAHAKEGLDALQHRNALGKIVIDLKA